MDSGENTTKNGAISSTFKYLLTINNPSITFKN
jgi:hypothetical protein